LSEDPVSKESLETVKDYLEELAERVRKEAGRDRPRPTHLFSALQQQHLINKILKKKEAAENRSLLEQEDMFRACQMGYEGIDEYREDAMDNFDKLSDGITLEKYEAVLAPLGNFILGSKTLKEYCTDYLQSKQMGKIGRHYHKMKQKIADIDEETDKIIEDKYTISIQRDFGVIPRAKKDQIETIFNIDGQPLQDIDDFAIIDIIKKYEQKTGKKAMWRNAKTRPFLKFLGEHILAEQEKD